MLIGDIMIKKWPKKAIIIMIFFTVLTPLGILASGEAWGEWDISDWSVSNNWKSIASKLANLWSAPLSDYNLPNWDTGILPYIGYIFSAIIGTSILIVLAYVLGLLMVRRK